MHSNFQCLGLAGFELTVLLPSTLCISGFLGAGEGLREALGCPIRRGFVERFILAFWTTPILGIWTIFGPPSGDLEMYTLAFFFCGSAGQRGQCN